MTVEVNDVFAQKEQILDKSTFLEAMSRVPQAVFIVTTDGEAGKAGLTATAVTSVSADPPSMVVCLNASNFSTAAFYKNKRININSLNSEHKNIANMFGKSVASGLIDPTPDQLQEASEKRFATDEWEAGTCPVLKNARAVFECDISDVKLVDTHLVIFAKVNNLRLETLKLGTPVLEAPSSALVYLERGYKDV